MSLFVTTLECCLDSIAKIFDLTGDLTQCTTCRLDISQSLGSPNLHQPHKISQENFNDRLKVAPAIQSFLFQNQGHFLFLGVATPRWSIFGICKRKNPCWTRPIVQIRQCTLWNLPLKVPPQSFIERSFAPMQTHQMHPNAMKYKRSVTT